MITTPESCLTTLQRLGVRDRPSYTASTRQQFTNALDSKLFQIARLSTESLRYYGLGLENGNYAVNLQFAELVIQDQWMQDQWRCGYSPDWNSTDFIPTVSNTPPSTRKKNDVGLITGIIVPIVVVSILALLALYIICQQRKKQDTFDDYDDITRLGFQYSLYPCVLHDYLSFRDVPLPLLEEVHPVLPNRGNTIHERPAGKIGLYTRFFDFANFRLPLSTFLVDILRDPAPVVAEFDAQDYATLVAHPSPFWKFPEEFLCLVGLSCHYTLYEDTYPSFMDKDGEDMDIFAFIHNTDPTKVKVIEREQQEDEPRLLETTIGRIIPLLPVAPDRGERDSAGGGKDINIQPVTETIGTVVDDAVPLQPQRQRKRKTIVSDAGGPSHPPKRLREDHRTPSGASLGGKSRSVVQRLLTGAVQNAKVRGEPIPTLPFVTSSVFATPEREDEGHTNSVTGLNLRTIGVPQRFVISSDYSHHSGANISEAEVDSFARPSIPVITAATIVTSTVDPDVVVKEKVVRPSIFSVDSTSAGGTDPAMGGFTDLTGSDFLVGGIRTIINPDSDLQKVYIPQCNVTNGSRLDDGGVYREMVDEFTPPKFFAYVRGMEHDQPFIEFNVGAARQMSLSAEVRMRAEYNIKERRRLKSVVEERDILLKARDEEIRSLKAQLLLKEAEVAEAICLRVVTSKFESVEKSLQGEVEVLKERNTTLEKEKNEVDVKVVDLAASVKVREQEVADLDAVVASVKSQNDNLVNQVHELEASSAILQEKVSVCENFTEQLEKFQDEQMKVVNDKFDKLYTDFIEMALHLEERFYPHLLTTIAGRRWLLTHGMELAVTKCLNSPEYLSALGAAISKAIEKGMQDGLAARITHGKEGRVLADVAAYNPFAKVDYVFTLRQLQSVNFSLLAELKLNKDSSVETLMNILRLEETLAERLGLNESQPHVDQLMVPINHSLDQPIVGATALSLSLDISHARVQKIRENIANYMLALHEVFIPLVEPFSAMALEGTGGTSDTTTTLSITLASSSTIISISVDDYEVAGTDDQAAANENVANENLSGGDVNPFPNVDDAELNVPE
ncbi:gypsy type transposase [Tanacetum coccineum]